MWRDVIYEVVFQVGKIFFELMIYCHLWRKIRRIFYRDHEANNKVGPMPICENQTKINKLDFLSQTC